MSGTPFSAARCCPQLTSGTVARKVQRMNANTATDTALKTFAAECAEQYATTYCVDDLTKDSMNPAELMTDIHAAISAARKHSQDGGKGRVMAWGMTLITFLNGEVIYQAGHEYIAYFREAYGR